MSEIWSFLKELTDPESIIRHGGLALLLFVLFAETGLLIGFFLPGDSLVFIAGLICATNPALLGVSIYVLIPLMCLAAIFGNMAGYWFGKKVGPSLFKREDNWLFKKKRLYATQRFYGRHGGKTLILGRFLPVIRTFAPILAGVIKIDLKKFMLFNVVGAIAWIGSFTGIGFFLGSSFPKVKDYLGWIVISLIIVTAIPVFSTYLKERNRKQDDLDNLDY